MFADILLFNYSLGQTINIPHKVLMLHTGDYIFNMHAVIKVTKLNNGCNICTACSLRYVSHLCYLKHEFIIYVIVKLF